MVARRCARHRDVLAGLFILLGLGRGHLIAPTPVHAQAESSQSRPRPTARLSAKAPAAKAAARKHFRTLCAKCHGTDGTGKQARSLQPEIPDFSAASWQARRNDAQLLASILDGKGQDMPPFRGKIKKAQARDLVAHVRAFAPTTGERKQKKRQEPSSPDEFEDEFRRLEKDMDRLKSKAAAETKRSRPSASSPRPPSTKPAQSSPQSGRTKPSAKAAAGAPTARGLFRQYCVKCHGADGTGSGVRHRQPDIPDFTDPVWQDRRGDARLLRSILNGKGKDMPPWRGKINTQQARGLAAHVRTFAETVSVPEGEPQGGYDGRSGDFTEDQQGPIPAELVETKPSRAFVEKLIGWLGKLHPPAVHFPIALLTAAALAELLRLATGKPAFDAVSRFCVWFGALAALVASVLGWFCGGFRLTDASWVMMTHRWLGTAVMACAGLVLVLTEASRAPGRRRTQIWFRVILLIVAALVLVTGFFGGAVVFGLDHYLWPR
jgi:mono/diheme cytochrome c family protein/uncharacterized membrane protein